MSTRVGRNVKVTTCECLVVDENNDTHKQTITLYGDYSDITRAQNRVRKELQNRRVLVTGISQDSFYVSMPIEEFIKNGQITEHKE